jgi:hypothetical protein
MCKSLSNYKYIEGTAELLQQNDKIVTLQAYDDKYSEELRRICVTAEAFTTLYSQAIRVTTNHMIMRQ